MSAVRDDDDDAPVFTVWDTKRGNAIGWADTFDRAKEMVEARFRNIAGLVLLDPDANEVYRWYGPLVAP